ncbi:MAG: adenosylmethionine decarboxylase [Caldisphaeraceae archaeon]|nr:adenosylmethionine decarboxylase [Caldisphaeraceae archaeon]MEB3692164.1 adenosylmethionine decarboxylase [Caldisphaeraceae archaeon]MEB3797947.1 adenosylmethionine decarboxylase [Caldisphaeraceae archaeon]
MQSIYNDVIVNNNVRTTIDSRRPRVVGVHVYGNLKGVNNESMLTNEKGLWELLRRAGEIGNMTILDIRTWKIGEGVSAVAIVLESHITIHTWPEFRFATVDVYSCGPNTDPKKAFDYIVSELKPEDVEFEITDRSLE